MVQHSELDIDSDDVDILLEALQAWETKDQATDMLVDILGAGFSKGDPEAKERNRVEQETRNAQRKVAASIRKEQSVLLQAKLLRFRNRALADSIARGAS